jgi:ATP-binding cassette, subfamily C, bacterial
MWGRVRTPTILQSESVECGAAALGIVLAHWGRRVPLWELREACGISRDGCSAAHMVKAAGRFGLEGKGYRLEVPSLKELPRPFIVHWQFDHFVVVEGFGWGKVYLNDPSTGPRIVTDKEFDDSFTGVALVFQRTAEFRRGGNRASLMRSIGSRLLPHYGSVLFGILVGLLLAVPGLAAPVFAQIYVDRILIDGVSDSLRPLLWAMAGVLLLNAVLTYLKRLCLSRLRLGMVLSLSIRSLWHALHLPAGFYVHRYTGELATRLELNRPVADFLAGPFARLSLDAVLMVLYGTVMFCYDPQLAQIGIGLAACNALCLWWMARRRTDAHLRLQIEAGKADGTAMAGLRGMETLKCAAQEQSFFRRWSGHCIGVLQTQQELQQLDFRLSVLPPLLTALATIAVMLIGGTRVMDGALTLGMLVAFLGLMQNFQEPLAGLVGLAYELQELKVSLARLDEVLEHPLDTQLAALAAASASPSSQISRLQGSLELRDVTYGYAALDPPLIQNVSFTVMPGQRIALVGASGCGKSTIARLVAGLYTPWSGEILYDGRPRMAIPQEVLTRSIAVVEQDIVFVSGSVRENLTLWDTSVTEEELVQVCRDALILDAVLALPGGFEASLFEGAANLSGGERQRLEIARGLVARPSLLVLDEATSALDAGTEAAILRNLRRRGCACLIVAHRISTIRDCDEIVVLQGGRVVQRGTHRVLERQAGEYARLIHEEEGGDAADGE